MITVFNTRETQEYKELQEAKEEISKLENEIQIKEKTIERMKEETKRIKNAISKAKQNVEKMIKYAMSDSDYEVMTSWNGKPKFDTSIAYKSPFDDLYFFHSVVSYESKQDCLKLIKEFDAWLERKIETMPADTNPYSPRKKSLQELAKVRAEIAFIGEGGNTVEQKKAQLEQLKRELNQAIENKDKASKAYKVICNMPVDELMGYKTEPEPIERYSAELVKQEKFLGLR